MKTIAVIIFAAVFLYLLIRRAKKRKLLNAAYNILLAQFTFYNEDIETQNKVYERAREILKRSTNDNFAENVFDKEQNPLVIFGFYALAMKELNVEPALYGFNEWFEVNNPFIVEVGIKEELSKATKVIEAKTNVCYDHWVR
ncbi:hypothetical protein ACPTGO_00405 [Pseudomonas aeruginosa]|uniref:hypothetical protein n=1 Tax=Pseudomonas aeruginosa TaxID=287 RepID=UPI003CC65FA2